MKQSEKMLQELRQQGEELKIPKSLEPEWMEETLKEQEKKQFFRRGKVYPALATVACVCIIGAAVLQMNRQGLLSPEQKDAAIGAESGQELEQDGLSATAAADSEEDLEELILPSQTYEEIYERLSSNWTENPYPYYDRGGLWVEEVAAGEAETGAVNGSVDMPVESVEDFAAMESATADAASQKESEKSFGKTNVQVENIDEADKIKNDGRYLYQIVMRETNSSAEESPNNGKQVRHGIQIVDTKEGLKEVAFVSGFDSIEEFYVWEDLLITIENKYYETARPELMEDGNKYFSADLLYPGNPYHEIAIFDIKDRTSPREVKTFTLQGGYESSRIADGCFYGISRFTARKGEGVQDYEAYIPSVDGVVLPKERIYCPEYESGTQYLVVVSVDLQEPAKLKDSRAVLSDSGHYYMSQKNLYVASYESVWEMEPAQEGRFSDQTRLLRFAYSKGRIYAQAEGKVPGRLDSSFSLDEYRGNLRAVSTVEAYLAQKVTDDRTGELLGYDWIMPNQSNALYVLNEEMEIIGSVEGLAEEEQIYSARFWGDIGYFVTFRQTDPLFAVDLKDPENPKVLGELKVSGFSEYLHFWGENLLLGIGMEADEETGQTQGMKLSMFDISNPVEMKEIAREPLAEYYYSEALYDHKAVLLDVGENIIGFMAEGSQRGDWWLDYLVYSYEDGDFVQDMKLDIGENRGYYRARGTYIGETFYLLTGDGHVKAYDRNGGKLVEEI